MARLKSSVPALISDAHVKRGALKAGQRYQCEACLLLNAKGASRPFCVLA